MPLQKTTYRALAAVILLASPSLAIDTVVVCPAVYRDTIDDWVRYRSAQGYRINVLSGDGNSEAIQMSIRRVAADHKLKAIVLVGDAPGLGRPRVSPHRLATGYVRSRVITAYGGEDHIASDNGYADLDGDEIPDVAIGRLPADSPDALAAMIEKIVSYEANPDFGAWRRQVHFIAGVGGFGPLIDRAVETTTKMFLTHGIPAAYETSMTQASWTSPYCPDPRRFSQTCIARLNQGCLFWIYMGHGNPQSLDELIVPARRYPILTNQDLPKIRCQSRSPVALMFCCYAGAIDATGDCIAEEMVRSPAGPVAAIAGSRVTMPYAMAVLGNGMLTEYFQQRRKTIGDVFLHAKRYLAKSSAADTRRKMLDSLASLLTAGRHDLGDERRDHLYLFNLLGDPLLQIPQPQPVVVTAPRQATAGSEVTITAASPIDGHAKIELTVRRDRLTFTPPTRIEYDESHDGLAAFDPVYRQANNPQLLQTSLQIVGGPVDSQIRIPDDATGACHVRVYVQGKHGFAMGSSNITITPAPAENQ